MESVVRNNVKNNDCFTATEAADYLLFSRNSLYYHVRKGNIKQEPDGKFLKSSLDQYRKRLGYATDDTAFEEDWKERYILLLNITVELQRATWTLFKRLYKKDLDAAGIDEE